MNIKGIALLTLIATMSLGVPVIAQTLNPSQEFFERGREQLEREIQMLQAEPFHLEENLEKPPSKPLLEVSPFPTNPPSETPQPIETPTVQPQEGENQEQRVLP